MGIFDRFRGRGGDEEPEADPRAPIARIPHVDEPAHPKNQQPAGFRLPADLGLEPEVEHRFRAFLWNSVLTTDEPDLLDIWGEELAAEGIGDEQADRAFAAVLEARRDQQAAWREDDVLPLAAAFADLAEVGIVAREDFSCCGTCAPGEIHDERDDSRTWRGYVYYHQQDTERLIADRETYLGYGAFVDALTSPEAWEAMSNDEREATYARETVTLMEEAVLPVFERHGIEVEWDHDLDTRIQVKGVDTVVLV